MSDLITITLPATFTASGSDRTITIDPSNWSDPQAFAEYLINTGLGVIMQRASAGKKDDAEKAAKAVDAAVLRLTTGVVPSGGGFTKLTPEDYALKEALMALKVKFLKSETVPACLLRLATSLATEDSDVETTQASLVAKLHSTEVYKTSLKARTTKTKSADNLTDFLAS